MIMINIGVKRSMEENITNQKNDKYDIGKEIYFNTIKGNTIFYELTYVIGYDKNYIYLDNGYIIDKYSNILFTNKDRKISKEFFLTSEEQNLFTNTKQFNTKITDNIVYKYNILGIFYRLEFGPAIKKLDPNAVVYVYVNNVKTKYNYTAGSTYIHIHDFGIFLYDRNKDLTCLV